MKGSYRFVRSRSIINRYYPVVGDPPSGRAVERLTSPESWLMRFPRCWGLTCDWQTAARGPVDGHRESRRSVFSSGNRSEMISAISRPRGFRYLAGIIWPSAPEARGYEVSYKIIPASDATVHHVGNQRCVCKIAFTTTTILIQTGAHVMFEFHLLSHFSSCISLFRLSGRFVFTVTL